MADLGSTYGFSLETDNTVSLFRGFSLELLENLSVFVVDQDGNIVDEATVTINVNNDPELTGQTNEDGVILFYIPEGSPNIINISATKDGYGQAIDNIDFVGGSAYKVVYLTLTTPARYFFMTTKPLSREIFKNSPEWIYVFPTSSGNIDMFYKIYYQDGSDYIGSIQISEMTRNIPFAVPIGYDFIDYESFNTDKKLVKIDFYLNDFGDDTVTVYPKPEGDFQTTFYYFNSYGGLDTLTCTGDDTKSFQVSSQPIKISDLDGNKRADTVQSLGQWRHSIMSGYKDRTAIEAIADMLFINDVYILINDAGVKKFARVIIENSEFVFPSKKSNLKALQFSYRIADEQYSFIRRA